MNIPPGNSAYGYRRLQLESVHGLAGFLVDGAPGGDGFRGTVANRDTAGLLDHLLDLALEVLGRGGCGPAHSPAPHGTGLLSSDRVRPARSTGPSMAILYRALAGIQL